MPKKQKQEHDHMNALDKRVTVRLSKYHFEAIERIAIREGFNPSVVVRHLVARFVENDMMRNAASPRPTAPMSVFRGGKQ